MVVLCLVRSAVRTVEVEGIASNKARARVQGPASGIRDWAFRRCVLRGLGLGRLYRPAREGLGNRQVCGAAGLGVMLREADETSDLGPLSGTRDKRKMNGKTQQWTGSARATGALQAWRRPEERWVATGEAKKNRGRQSEPRRGADRAAEPRRRGASAVGRPACTAAKAADRNPRQQ